MSYSCDKCRLEKEESEIINLQCTHSFCWSCIDAYLKENLNFKVKCPHLNCSKFLRDQEIRKVLPEEDIERYVELCVRNLPGSYKCTLPECGFVTNCDSIDMQFDCYRCSMFNCVRCKVAHKNMLCGDLSSKEGELLHLVCQKEMERARKILEERGAVKHRESIAARDKEALVPNTAIFECGICSKCVGKLTGVTLRQCLDQICRDCLSNHITKSSCIPVRCPFSPCQGLVEDRECRAALSEEEARRFERSGLMQASGRFKSAEFCRKTDCEYLCEVDGRVTKWTCPLCQSVNCVRCGAIHPGQTCVDYQASRVPSLDEIYIEEQIRLKKCMRCPDCKTTLSKSGGCNWLPCPSCGVELCYITQQLRWGPKGPGDISGGCRCGVEGPCAPDCGGCIVDLSRRHPRYKSRCLLL